MFLPFSDTNLGVDSNLIVHFIYQKAQCICYFLSDYIFSKCSPFTKIKLPILLLLFSKRRVIHAGIVATIWTPGFLWKHKFKNESLKNFGSLFPICLWCFLSGFIRWKILFLYQQYHYYLPTSKFSWFQWKKSDPQMGQISSLLYLLRQLQVIIWCLCYFLFHCLQFPLLLL